MELPRPEAKRRERADAARNRARVLAAAERLFAEGDGRDVTMEQLAAAAGVGKATLYRRYPDVPSIALALLDEHERALQEEILRGPPPLGPGAPPAERLAAFYRAMVDLLERHGHLALAAETGARRYQTGAYRAWAMHVGTLLEEAGLGENPALVDALLAPLTPDVFAHQRAEGLPAERLVAGLSLLARRALAG
ncbi:MAG: TetR/AcrR family transcriptional regulator [Thermoleophilaceae bacterium]